MYTFEPRTIAAATRAPDAAATRGAEVVGPTRVVPRVVVWIGVSSLLADVSAESVASALPVFLMSVLMLSPLEIGALDGLYQGGAALVRVVAGAVADRRGSNRSVALLGYGLAVLSRVGFLLSGTAGLLVALASLCLDRVGKGIRTAPRDALIARHARPGQVGAAFGVHRALDAGGALAGPLLSAGVLAFAGYDTLFLASLAFGVVGWLVFRDRVPEHARPADGPEPARSTSVPEQALRAHVPELARPARVPEQACPAAEAESPTDDPVTGGALAASRPGPTLRDLARLLAADRGFAGLCVLAMALSAFTISDGLLYLTLQRGAGLDARLVPLMFAGTALAFLLAAPAAGRLADKQGPLRLFVSGYLLLALLYGALAAFGDLGVGGAWCVVALLGLHYAATDGVLAALAVGRLDPRARTTGLAVLGTGIGLARLAGSALFGAAWQGGGTQFARLAFAIGMATACGVGVLVLARARPRRPVGTRRRP